MTSSTEAVPQDAARDAQPWPRPARVGLALVVLIGAALRVLQFAAGRSLWLDEAGLALNILARRGARLFDVLDYGQMAPSGFLLLQKGLTQTLGAREWVFRLWPLAAGLAAVAIMAVAARRLLPPVAGLTAAALFAANHRLIYYASENKQYSGDVLAAVLLLVLGLSASRGSLTWRVALGLGATGAVAGWLSHPSLFVSAGIGAALLIALGRRRDLLSLRRLCATFVIWGTCLAPVLMINLRSVGVAADREYMMRSWSGGFPPTPLLRRASIAWIATAPRRLFEYLFDAGPWVAALLLVLCVLGAIGAKGGPRGVRALLLLPLVAGVSASFLHLLPLAERVGLWVTPFAVLLAGFGIAWLSRASRPPWSAAAPVLGAALAAFAGVQASRALPERREELWPVLAAVSERLHAATGVYLYYGAVPAFRYYSPRVPELAAIRLEGRCARNQWPRYVEEIVPVGREAKIWIVFSHAQKPEADFILASLDRLGTRADAVEQAGAAAYLYAFPVLNAEQVGSVARAVPPDRDRSAPDWVCLGGPLSARNWPADVPVSSP